MQRTNSCFTVLSFTVALTACAVEGAAETSVSSTHSNLSVTTPSDGQTPATNGCTPSEVHSPELQGTAHALVLYDTDGQWGYLGELYAAGVGTLASHFGTWHAA